MTEKITISEATKEEVASILIAGANAEQWNLGAKDLAPWHYSVDNNGFFVIRLNGKIIGMVSGVKYGLDSGYIGFYIIYEQYRGNGYGLKVFQHAMQYLQGRNIGLAAVMQQVPNYKKSGFHEVG